VNDATSVFQNQLEEGKNFSFQYKEVSPESALDLLKNSSIYGVLNIVKKDSNFQYNLIANEQPGLSTLNAIEGKLENILKAKKMKEKGVEASLLKEINSISVEINTQKATGNGLEEGNSGITTIVGFIGAFLIYLFIFLYGVQVMKGVIEEKTNRIVEVIISSVKPFQLMMGKIVGIAMVGFTQFIIWVLLVTLLSAPVSSLVMNLADIEPNQIAQNVAPNLADSTPQIQSVQANPSLNMLNGLNQLNVPLLLGLFIFYFIGGYLFYGALFAAVGSAVDNETDTQQFMMPITLPLIFSIAISQSIINAPNSTLSVWLSMIPFSSPVIMMVRLPFGVPTIEIIASMLCMVLGFIATVWFAGRIYRIGILTYGKKPSYKDLAKWLFRKS
ncbi:MAG: ABC transporter permease, partial [Bacteroidia bacterium]|nr:ABC transporter permease [Bacteroidia bacterium]